MDRDQAFVDFYELMQISPSAELETVQRVYRILSARWHPDNPETGDLTRFILLKQAHGVLADPDARAAYNRSYQAAQAEPLDIFNLKEFASGIDGEGNRRMGILCLLYNRRRSNDDHPGISLLEFERLMSFPREHLLFTIWYLTQRALIARGEESSYSITAAGVDYVEQHLPQIPVLGHLLRAGETGTERSAGLPLKEAPGSKGV